MKLLYLVESGESKFLVFDEMPDKISTKYGDDTIIGRIGGIFYDFLAKRNGRREAFGGRKFDIILDNGKVEKCEGQWWDAVTDRAKVSMPIYKTAEDAAQETNPVQYKVLNIESFSLKYLPYLVWDGIQFCGWLWDGSRPVKRATREPLRVCKIYGGKVTFVDYSGNEYYAEHFRRFYQTAKQCREANKPKIVMLDEEGDDFAKQKHDEFYAYVKHHCPGFEDKIEWEYFQAYKTMPWNLSQQVKFWSNYGIAFK